MRKCLAPFFVGQFEHGFEERHDWFDIVLPESLVHGVSISMDALVNVNLAICDFVYQALADDCVPLVLCGDCLSAIGCLAGLEKSSTQIDYLFWFDGHGDFHTYATSISGHLGGMPLAMLTGRGDQELLAKTCLTPLSDDRICLIGARDLEPGEREALRDSGITIARNFSKVAAELLRMASIWVHFDTDYLNPLDAPAMRYPAQGGPRAQVVFDELAAVASNFTVLGVSVSAWTPGLDKATQRPSTAEACWYILSALGNLR